VAIITQACFQISKSINSNKNSIHFLKFGPDDRVQNEMSGSGSDILTGWFSSKFDRLLPPALLIMRSCGDGKGKNGYIPAGIIYITL
jgi:hypothetical protein